jgi:hypothetical protein
MVSGWQRHGVDDADHAVDATSPDRTVISAIWAM